VKQHAWDNSENHPDVLRLTINNTTIL